MPSSAPQRFHVDSTSEGAILAVLRLHLPDLSWSAARRIMSARRILVNEVLCLDEGRRISVGEIITILPHSLPPPPDQRHVKIIWQDDAIIVVEKPPRMLTLRHPSEQSWPKSRRDLQPTLDECLLRLLESKFPAPNKRQKHKLYSVHRIDRDTSGLLVFARTEPAQAALIRQFAQHDVDRKYVCLIPGAVKAQTIRTNLVRDRGDGLRGSGTECAESQIAITHIRPLRQFGGYTELECKLETGRTNQIRIHLCELRHPLCGDIRYRGPHAQPPIEDHSQASRLALHAAELGFCHPVTGEHVHFKSPWPRDMLNLIERLSDVNQG